MYCTSKNPCFCTLLCYLKWHRNGLKFFATIWINVTWSKYDGKQLMDQVDYHCQAVLSGFAVHWMSHDRMLGILGFYTIGWILSNTKFITLGISLSWIEWFYINVGTLCIHNQGGDKLCKLQVTASLCYMRKACLAFHLYLLMGNLCFGSRLMNYSYSQ